MHFIRTILTLASALLCLVPLRGETIHCSPGRLAELLGEPDKKIENLVLTGSIDVRDLRTLAAASSMIGELRLTDAKIEEYHNTAVPKSERRNYRANTLPDMIFASAAFDRVYLPNTLETIGRAAFAGAEISGINFSDGLQSIGEMAFAGCPNLTNVELPASVRTIGNQAFYSCPELINADMQACAIDTIPYQAFARDPHLISIKLPQTLKYVADEAFMGIGTRNTSNIIPPTTKIGKYVFAHTQDAEIACCFCNTLPEGTYFAASSVRGMVGAPDEIGPLALADTEAILTSSNLKSTCHIGFYALANSASSELSMGSDTDYIDSHALCGMDNLKKILVHSLGADVIPVHAEAFCGIAPENIELVVDSEEAIPLWSAHPQWGLFHITSVQAGSHTPQIAESGIHASFSGQDLLVEAPENIETIYAYNLKGRMLFEAQPGADSALIDTSEISESIWIISVRTPSRSITFKLIRP